MDKKKLYIIIIAVAAAVLIGLLIWAICLSVNKPAGNTETTGAQIETTLPIDENDAVDGLDATDATAEATEGTEETTDPTADTTDPTATTTEDEDESGDENSEPQENKKPDNNKTDSNKPNGDQNDGNDSNEENTPTSSTKPAPTEPALPNVYPYTLTWKEYKAMSEEEQIAFYKQFPNHSEYKAWYNAAKKKYDEEKIEIEIGEDGTIDLDKLLNG